MQRCRTLAPGSSISPDFGQGWPASANTGQNTAKVRPKLEQDLSTLADVGRMLAHVCSKVGQMLAGFWSNLEDDARVDQKLVIPGQRLDNYCATAGQLWGSSNAPGGNFLGCVARELSALSDNLGTPCKRRPRQARRYPKT